MGVNNVTGDYSRGAAGFWIEQGELTYPVSEITIAGNLPEMFQRIVAGGRPGVPLRRRRADSDDRPDDDRGALKTYCRPRA